MENKLELEVTNTYGSTALYIKIVQTFRAADYGLVTVDQIPNAPSPAFRIPDPI